MEADIEELNQLQEAQGDVGDSEGGLGFGLHMFSLHLVSLVYISACVLACPALPCMPVCLCTYIYIYIK